jgi:hypothetical protein
MVTFEEFKTAHVEQIQTVVESKLRVAKAASERIREAATPEENKMQPPFNETMSRNALARIMEQRLADAFKQGEEQASMTLLNHELARAKAIADDPAAFAKVVSDAVANRPGQVRGLRPASAANVPVVEAAEKPQPPAPTPVIKTDAAAPGVSFAMLGSFSLPPNLPVPNIVSNVRRNAPPPNVRK